LRSWRSGEPRVSRPGDVDDRSRSGRARRDPHRAEPQVCDAGAGHDFYVDFLGLEKEFDPGWIASFRSPENCSIQVSLVSRDASAPEDAAISVNVDDVDAAYIKARRRGYEIGHPLTEEPWGARRFFVRDTNGVVVNVVGDPD
jgi:predicted enzyme related to lactoylglutathione lyase